MICFYGAVLFALGCVGGMIAGYFFGYHEHNMKEVHEVNIGKRCIACNQIIKGKEDGREK